MGQGQPGTELQIDAVDKIGAQGHPHGRFPSLDVTREWLEARLWMSVSEMSRLLGCCRTGSAVRSALERHGLWAEYRRLHVRMVREGCPCGRHDPAQCRILDAVGQPVLCEITADAPDGPDVTEQVAGAEMLGEDVARRLWDRVDQDGPGGCWLWRGHVSGHSAPHFKASGVNTSAARLMWEIAGREPLGPRDSLLARCGNAACVNPDHRVKVKRGTKFSDWKNGGDYGQCKLVGRDTDSHLCDIRSGTERPRVRGSGVAEGARA